MPNHTPKPWKIVPDGQGRRLVAGGRSPDPVTRARYLFIAEVFRPGQHEEPGAELWNYLTDEESAANERLIERAPLLYDVGYRLAMLALQSERYAEDPEFAEAVRQMIDLTT